MARRNSPKRWLVCLVVLAAAGASLLVVRVVPSGRGAAEPSPRHPLVGTWTPVRSRSPAAILDIRADGTASRTDFQNASGANPVTVRMRWRAEGDTFIFEMKARGALGKLKQLVGPPCEERIPILSITEDEIAFAGQNRPVVYRRYEGPLTKHLNRK